MIKHNLSVPVLNHLNNDLHKQYIRIQRIHPGAHNFFSEYLDFSSFLPPYQKKNRDFFFFFCYYRLKINSPRPCQTAQGMDYSNQFKTALGFWHKHRSQLMVAHGLTKQLRRQLTILSRDLISPERFQAEIQSNAI